MNYISLVRSNVFACDSIHKRLTKSDVAARCLTATAAAAGADVAAVMQY